MPTPDYGTDFACDTDIDPMLRTVSGETHMAQAMVRRLFTRKGLLLSDPLYGIDLRDFLSSKVFTNNDITKIEALIKSELLRDERVASVDATATFSVPKKTLTVRIKGTGALGPFSLTIAVTSVSVTLLNAT